jgi:hypothetical protein
MHRRCILLQGEAEIFFHWLSIIHGELKGACRKGACSVRKKGVQAKKGRRKKKIGSSEENSGCPMGRSEAAKLFAKKF